jgi:hypothetical protein
MSEEKKRQGIGAGNPLGFTDEQLRLAGENLRKLAADMSETVAATRARPAFAAALRHVAGVEGLRGLFSNEMAALMAHGTAERAAGEWLQRSVLPQLSPAQIAAMQQGAAALLAVAAASFMAPLVDWTQFFNFLERADRQCQKKASDQQDDSGSVRELDTVA